MEDRRDDAGRTIGRRRHDASARGVLLVDRHRPQVDPVHHRERIEGRTGCLAGDERSVEARRPPSYAQAAGKLAVGAETALHAVLHRPPDAQEARIDLLVGAPTVLVAPDDLGDRAALRLRERQELLAAAVREREAGRVGDAGAHRAVIAGQLLPDDEPAADRVVAANRELVAARADRDEPGVVDVERRRPVGALALAEHEVRRRIERDLPAAEEPEAVRRVDRGDAPRDPVHVDRVRLFALEAEDDGCIGAVTAAGGTERPVQLHPEASHLIQQTLALQTGREPRGGAHRPDRVGAGRSDADLQQVEGADGHGDLRSCSAALGQRAAGAGVDAVGWFRNPRHAARAAGTAGTRGDVRRDASGAMGHDLRAGGRVILAARRTGCRGSCAQPGGRVRRRSFRERHAGRWPGIVPPSPVVSTDGAIGPPGSSSATVDDPQASKTSETADPTPAWRHLLPPGQHCGRRSEAAP